MKVLSVFGTRPEAIKLAPVIEEMRKRNADVQSVVCVTGQHREMLDQVLELFGIRPDYDLEVMTPQQTLSQVAAAVLTRLEPVLQRERPDWVVVQGDTTTVSAAALAAFYARAKVAHVEAGLRTYDKWQPFPEEINRKVATAVADMHFAPTPRSRDNLLREGVPSRDVLVTGNPVIDAVQRIAALSSAPRDAGAREVLARLDGRRLALVTAHRRENHGRPLNDICTALRDLASARKGDLDIVYPLHLNPNVQDTARRVLRDAPNITLLPPLDYLSLVQLLKRAYLVLTDSGGIQEEAPSLGVPVLVLREVTERPEAVDAGTVKLVGTDPHRILAEAGRLLDDTEAHRAMSRAVNPYGDGRASQRIVSALLGEPVEPFVAGAAAARA